MVYKTNLVYKTSKVLRKIFLLCGYNVVILMLGDYAEAVINTLQKVKKYSKYSALRSAMIRDGTKTNSEKRKEKA